MIKKISLLTVFLIVYIFLMLPLSSYSGVAKIQDIRILNDAKNMVIYAILTDCFTKEIESVILAGALTTFTFTLDTYQERRFWFDRKISRAIVKHTIKYDNVKQTFSVSSTNGWGPTLFQDFESAKRAMTDLNGIVVAPTNRLVKGRNYYVRIKAKLEKVTLPSSVEYISLFASVGDFETDWYKQRLVY